MYIYGLHTYIYIYTYTHMHTAYVIQAEMEDRVKVIQNTRIPTEKMLSDNSDVTQGLKQPPLYLEQFLKHLNALDRTSYFLSMPAEALCPASFFLSFCLLRPRPES